MTNKTCSRCKETKPVSEFNKNRSSKDGLTFWCKGCKSESSRRYRETNRERVLEIERRYREANREKLAEKGRRYYEANKEKVAEKGRRYYEANREQRIRQSIEKHKEVNDRSLELAHRQRQPWEDWEEEFVLADNGLTTYQKAVRLNRSYYSVCHRKRGLKQAANA